MIISDLFSLKDKVALVTGGKQGIGLAVALMFAEAGADVAVCDYMNENGALDDAAEQIKKLGRRSSSVQADVSQQGQVASMVEKVLSEFNRIDILVNNAGISPGTPPIPELEEEDWNRVLDTNLKGTYLCARAASRGMIENNSGNIINFSSVEGVSTPRKASSPYGASKGGVIMLTRGLAWDLGPHNIRVNAIAPGAIETPMTRGMWDEEDPAHQNMINFIRAQFPEMSDERLREMMDERRRQMIPLGRMAKPREMASVALFLASEASSYVTGHTLIADGGMLA